MEIILANRDMQVWSTFLITIIKKFILLKKKYFIVRNSFINSLSF